jgi:hypothetical protein
MIRNRPTAKKFPEKRKYHKHERTPIHAYGPRAFICVGGKEFQKMRRIVDVFIVDNGEKIIPNKRIIENACIEEDNGSGEYSKKNKSLLVFLEKSVSVVVVLVDSIHRGIVLKNMFGNNGFS